MGSRKIVLAIVTLMLTIPLSAGEEHWALRVELTAGLAHVDDFVRQGLQGPPPPAPNETREELLRWPN